MAEFLEGTVEDEKKMMDTSIKNREKELYNVFDYFVYVMYRLDLMMLYLMVTKSNFK